MTTQFGCNAFVVYLEPLERVAWLQCRSSLAALHGELTALPKSISWI